MNEVLFEMEISASDDILHVITQPGEILNYSLKTYEKVGVFIGTNAKNFVIRMEKGGHMNQFLATGNFYDIHYRKRVRLSIDIQLEESVANNATKNNLEDSSKQRNLDRQLNISLRLRQWQHIVLDLSKILNQQPKLTVINY